MKKILIASLLLLLLASQSFGATWCMWSGTEGINCQGDGRGYLIMPDGHPISALPNDANYHGFYLRVDTLPSLGVNQVRDAEVWGFDGNEITLTWTVRDMTATEIDIRDAGPMPLSEYYLWKVLHLKGVITTQEIQDNLPQELQDAYMARDRLVNP